MLLSGGLLGAKATMRKLANGVEKCMWLYGPSEGIGSVFLQEFCGSGEGRSWSWMLRHVS